MLLSVALPASLYQPFAISVTALAHAPKAAPSMLRVAVTVSPVAGFPVVEFTMTNGNTTEVFFLTNSCPGAIVTRPEASPSGTPPLAPAAAFGNAVNPSRTESCGLNATNSYSSIDTFMPLYP